MKRTLVYLAVIFLGVEVAVRRSRGAVAAFDRGDTRASFAKMQLYGRAGAPDLCFMGSSRVDVGLKNDVFRGAVLFGTRIESVFNLGVAHGGVKCWLFGRRCVLRKPPKILIYGTSIFEFNRNYDDPGIALLPASDFAAYISLAPSFERAWSWAVLQVELLLEDHWMLYRYREALELMTYDALSRLLAGKLQVNAFGMAAKSQRQAQEEAASVDGYRTIIIETRLPDLMKEPRFDPHYVNLRDFRFGRVQKRLFEETLDGALAKGVKVVLVHMPVSQVMEEANYGPEMWRDYTGYLRRVAEQRNIPFLLLSREDCGLTDADFSDTGHLGPTGAEKFSRRLLEELRRLSGGPS